MKKIILPLIFVLLIFSLTFASAQESIAGDAEGIILNFNRWSGAQGSIMWKICEDPEYGGVAGLKHEVTECNPTTGIIKGNSMISSTTLRAVRTVNEDAAVALYVYTVLAAIGVNNFHISEALKVSGSADATMYDVNYQISEGVIYFTGVPMGDLIDSDYPRQKISIKGEVDFTNKKITLNWENEDIYVRSGTGGDAILLSEYETIRIEPTIDVIEIDLYETGEVKIPIFGITWSSADRLAITASSSFQTYYSGALKYPKIIVIPGTSSNFYLKKTSDRLLLNCDTEFTVKESSTSLLTGGFIRGKKSYDLKYGDIGSVFESNGSMGFNAEAKRENGLTYIARTFGAGYFNDGYITLNENEAKTISGLVTLINPIGKTADELRDIIAA